MRGGFLDSKQQLTAQDEENRKIILELREKLVHSNATIEDMKEQSHQVRMRPSVLYMPSYFFVFL